MAHMGEARFLRAMAPGRDVACIGATGLGKGRCMYIPAAADYNTAVSEGRAADLRPIDLILFPYVALGPMHEEAALR